MDTGLVLTSVLSSTVAVAIITAVKEVILWKMNRNAKVSDDKEAKEDAVTSIQEELQKYQESVKNLTVLLNQVESKLSISLNSSKVILKDRIKFIAVRYIRDGEISFDDKHNLHEMWHIYHFDLGGNGDLDAVMELVDELPLKEVLRQEGN